MLPGGRFSGHNSDSCCQIWIRFGGSLGYIYILVHAKAQVHGYILKGESGVAKVKPDERFVDELRKILFFLVDFATSNS